MVSYSFFTFVGCIYSPSCPVWLAPRSLSVSDGHSILGAASYLLYVLLTQQRGKCLLLCFLLPSALCHLPGSCWASLAQGYGMGRDAIPWLCHLRVTAH